MYGRSTQRSPFDRGYVAELRRSLTAECAVVKDREYRSAASEPGYQPTSTAIEPRDAGRGVAPGSLAGAPVDDVRAVDRMGEDHYVIGEANPPSISVCGQPSTAAHRIISGSGSPSIGRTRDLSEDGAFGQHNHGNLSRTTRPAG